MDFTIRRTFEAAFDAAVTRTTAALKSEGFGILTGIADFPRYRILGACAKAGAYRTVDRARAKRVRFMA